MLSRVQSGSYALPGSFSSSDQGIEVTGFSFGLVYITVKVKNNIGEIRDRIEYASEVSFIFSLDLLEGERSVQSGAGNEIVKPTEEVQEMKL